MKKIIIAKILKPQGIRGEVKLQPLVSRIQWLEEINTVYLSGEKTGRAIKGMRLAGGFAYAYIEGVISRNDADLLRGKEVFAMQENLQLSADEYLIDDMIGCAVTDEAGNSYGVVAEILQYGAADVYVLKNGDKTLMFPFVSGVMHSVDVKNKEIVVNADKLKEIMTD